MNDTREIQRLTDAITRLATILVETTASRVREQMPFAPAQTPQYVQRPIDNLMTKKDVAAYLKVSLRTVQNLMEKGHLPYIRLSGRSIRFMVTSVEGEMERRLIRARR